MQVIPDKLLLMFDAGEDMLIIGSTALRTISISFLFAGFSIVIVSSFQALGKGIYAMLISIARQLVVLIPVAYFFSLSGDLSKVWLAFPIAEVVSVAVSLFLFARLYKKVIIKIPE